MKGDSACHILDPRKPVFSIPYSVVVGPGAKHFCHYERWYIFLDEDLFHETSIEITLRFMNFSTCQEL